MASEVQIGNRLIILTEEERRSLSRAAKDIRVGYFVSHDEAQSAYWQGIINKLEGGGTVLDPNHCSDEIILPIKYPPSDS